MKPYVFGQSFLQSRENQIVYLSEETVLCSLQVWTLDDFEDILKIRLHFENAESLFNYITLL